MLSSSRGGNLADATDEAWLEAPQSTAGINASIRPEGGDA